MYYGDKKESKVNIMEALSARGWTIFGYKPDTSDSMTDYFNPASWDGIAAKNGYVLCVDIGEWNVKSYSGKETYEYTKGSVFFDRRTAEKIKKLQALADDPAASQGEFGEAGTALKKIAELKAKAEEYRAELDATKQLKEKYPAFSANPGRCNWHIERDGVIVAKGVGAFSFAHLPWEFDCGTMEWTERYGDRFLSEEEKERAQKYRSEYAKDIEKFKKLIDKIESAVSVKIGDGEELGYEKVIVTQYKTEKITEQIASDSLTADSCAGAYFKLRTSFIGGYYKGNVYKIDRCANGYVYAARMNRKLDKTLHGYATAANHFTCTYKNLKKWIDNKSIALVKIVERQIPYEVEKYVKKKPNKTVKQAGNSSENSSSTVTICNYDFVVMEDIHTQTGEKIFVYKQTKSVSKDEFKTINTLIKEKGGYYSKFKHGFIFKKRPV